MVLMVRHFKKMISKFTFDLPASRGTPTGANTNELEGHFVGILPRHERSNFILTANGDDSVVGPTDPEATEFATVQNVRGIHLNDIGLGAVLPDHGLGVLPAAEEDLDHGIGLCGTGGQSQMGIVSSANLETDNSPRDWVELVLQLVLSAEL